MKNLTSCMCSIAGWSCRSQFPYHIQLRTVLVFACLSFLGSFFGSDVLALWFNLLLWCAFVGFSLGDIRMDYWQKLSFEYQEACISPLLFLEGCAFFIFSSLWIQECLVLVIWASVGETSVALMWSWCCLRASQFSSSLISSCLHQEFLKTHLQPVWMVGRRSGPLLSWSSIGGRPLLSCYWCRVVQLLWIVRVRCHSCECASVLTPGSTNNYGGPASGSPFWRSWCSQLLCTGVFVSAPSMLVASRHCGRIRLPVVCRRVMQFLGAVRSCLDGGKRCLGLSLVVRLPVSVNVAGLVFPYGFFIRPALMSF